MNKLFFLIGLLLFKCLPAQERPDYLIDFYNQLQTLKFSDIKQLVISRADSQRVNILASNIDPKKNFADWVTLDNKMISIDYTNEMSISNFKRLIKSADIKKVAFKTVGYKIRQETIWETMIDISTKISNDSLFQFTDSAISLTLPAFTSYKCLINDKNGKIIKEIVSHTAWHYPLNIRNISKENLGIDNVLVLYLFDDKIIQLTYVKLD